MVKAGDSRIPHFSALQLFTHTS